MKTPIDLTIDAAGLGKVAVLFGGTSAERPVSLMSGTGVLEALATNGLVSILAEPNLTTMSGEPASFLAGGEYPYQVVTGAGGAQSVGYEFKQFGVSLAVVPTIISPTICRR